MVTNSDRGRALSPVALLKVDEENVSSNPLANCPSAQWTGLCVQSSGHSAPLAGAAAGPMKQLFQLWL